MTKRQIKSDRNKARQPQSRSFLVYMLILVLSILSSSPTFAIKRSHNLAHFSSHAQWIDQDPSSGNRQQWIDQDQDQNHGHSHHAQAHWPDFDEWQAASDIEDRFSNSNLSKFLSLFDQHHNQSDHSHDSARPLLTIDGLTPQLRSARLHPINQSAKEYLLQKPIRPPIV